MLVAIDTSTGYSSLALHDGHQVRAEHTWEAPRRHTVELLPRLKNALDQLQIGVDHLSGVAVTQGPGSFTGLRVGMAVAKGLALARGLPLVGVPTLDVVAMAQGRDHRPLCAVLEAGRGRICAATYRWRDGEWHNHEGPRLTTWPSLVEEITSPTLFCGEVDSAGIDILTSLAESAVLLPAATRLRRAGFLAEVAWQRLNRGDIDDPATLVPLYLK
jgi:tRNA threonylcarbamoyladenosine biosynthesis protein TsaB